MTRSGEPWGRCRHRIPLYGDCADPLRGVERVRRHDDHAYTDRKRQTHREVGAQSKRSQHRDGSATETGTPHKRRRPRTSVTEQAGADRGVHWSDGMTIALRAQSIGTSERDSIRIETGCGRWTLRGAVSR